MRILVALLFLCSVARGQFLSPGLDWSAVPVPTTTPKTLGANYWWVSSDMPTNIFVTNWVDRIQSSVWTNGTTGATRPTNNVLGVAFTAANSTVLTNSGVTFGTTSTHFVILQRYGSGIFQDILDQANSGLLEWYWNNQSKWLLEVNAVGTLIDGNPGASVFFDMAITSDPGNNQCIMYTNGTVAVTTSSLTINGAWNIMGGIGNSGFFDGYIKELAIDTNHIWTPSMISQAHKYATNLYGYTP